jgi:glycosyltransferase involved in cell wall biosynthesis
MIATDFPLVSVIIPVYNAEKYLGQCIQSIIGQNYPHLEIIVVDNGSTDSSEAVAKSFAKVIYLKEPRKSAAIARNTGIKAAQGKYIQFLDADDFLHPNKINQQVDALAGRENALALGDTIYFFDGEKPTNQTVKKEWFAAGSNDTVDFIVKLYGGSLVGPQYGGMIQPNAWLSPKKMIENAGLWNEELTLDDDGEFFCRLILAAKEIVYAEGSLNFYRKFRNGNNLSAKKNRTAYESQLLSNELKCKYVLEATKQQIAKTIFARIFMESAFTFYPAFKELAKKAANTAKNLDSDYIFTPYAPGLKSKLAKLLGWKIIRILENHKARF